MGEENRAKKPFFSFQKDCSFADARFTETTLQICDRCVRNVQGAERDEDLLLR